MKPSKDSVSSPPSTLSSWCREELRHEKAATTVCGKHSSIGVQFPLVHSSYPRSLSSWSLIAQVLQAIQPSSPPPSAVCYGIGPLVGCRPAQCQLALFLILCDALRQRDSNRDVTMAAAAQEHDTTGTSGAGSATAPLPRHTVPHSLAASEGLARAPPAHPASAVFSAPSGPRLSLVEPTVFDPVLSVTERVALARLGCHVPEANNGCAYIARKPALVFMPHGGLQMYDNLLAANWRAGTLPHVCLVGNDLRGYALRLLPRELAQHAPHVDALQSALCVDDALPPYETLPGAFNDTRVQTFPSAEESLALPHTAVNAGPQCGTHATLASELDLQPLPTLPPEALAAMKDALGQTIR